jgi:MFS family permease
LLLLERCSLSTMNDTARGIQRVYLTLTLGNTLAASFIWGSTRSSCSTPGSRNLEAFAANAFFTAGMMLFEVPTGVVADVWGRRVSYLLGTLTLAGSTFLYWLLWQMSAPFWTWAIVSMLLGLGFTFFSGAVEAGSSTRSLRGVRRQPGDVMGRGQMVGGAAMLGGSVLGGVIAQVTNLGVPFLMRVGVLVVMFFVARGRCAISVHAGAVRASARRGEEGVPRVDRLRPAQPARALGDARGARSRPASASTRSTRCSRTCSSSGATQRVQHRRPRRRDRRRARRSSAATCAVVPEDVPEAYDGLILGTVAAPGFSPRSV